VTLKGNHHRHICVANKPVTRAVADDLSEASFDWRAFPGTLIEVEQRRIG